MICLDRYKTITHLRFGPSLTEAEILVAIPDVGKAALIIGYIIDLHSFSVRAQTSSGYFNLEDIIKYKTF